MYKRLFIDWMEQNGKRYELKEDRIHVSFNCENVDSIRTAVFFDKDGDGIVQIKSWCFPNLKAKYDEAIVLCNELNSEWRWVSFSVDDDGDICASIDSYLEPTTCGDICWKLICRLVDICDNSYEKVAKLRWS